jgi:hypothetical protein
VTATGILSFVVIAVVSGLFGFMDFFLWPERMRKYKIQPNTNEPPDFKKILKVNQEINEFNCIGIFEFIDILFLREEIVKP